MCNLWDLDPKQFVWATFHYIRCTICVEILVEFGERLPFHLLPTVVHGVAAVDLPNPPHEDTTALLMLSAAWRMNC